MKQRIITDPGTLDAIRKCIIDFDGKNFDAVIAYLVNAGNHTAADVMAMSDMQLRMAFATGQAKFISTIGKAATATNTVQTFQPSTQPFRWSMPMSKEQVMDKLGIGRTAFDAMLNTGDITADSRQLFRHKIFDAAPQPQSAPTRTNSPSTRTNSRNGF